MNNYSKLIDNKKFMTHWIRRNIKVMDIDLLKLRATNTDDGGGEGDDDGSDNP